MKKIIVLVLCFLVTTSVFAFEPGEKLVWAEAGFTSHKHNSDSDAVNYLDLNAMVGYFLMKDISLDVLFAYHSTTYPGDSKDSSTYSDLFLGLGGSFFINSFYANAGILYNIYSYPGTMKSDNMNVNSMYLSLGGGYLFPLIENVFVDIGAHYTFGLGDYAGDGEGKNEQSEISVGAGLVVNLP